jgi:hypothetical protein
MTSFACVLILYGPIRAAGGDLSGPQVAIKSPQKLVNPRLCRNFDGVCLLTSISEYLPSCRWRPCWSHESPQKLVNARLCRALPRFACLPVLDGPVPAAGGDLAGLEGVPLAPDGHLVVRLERPEDLARLPVPEEEPPLRVARHQKPARSERGRI